MHEKLEELERLRDRRSSVDLAPNALGLSTATSVASVEKVEGIAKAVQALTSGTDVMRSRQATFENRCVGVYGRTSTSSACVKRARLRSCVQRGCT